VVLALGLLSSVLWGSADFVGGRLSRLLPAYSVIFVAQVTALIGTVLLLTVLLLTGADLSLSAPAICWGGLAGLAGVVALGAFYRALAIGQMSLVAPVASTCVALPVIVGVLREAVALCARGEEKPAAGTVPRVAVLRRRRRSRRSTAASRRPRGSAAGSRRPPAHGPGSGPRRRSRAGLPQ
jgi:uncharacterized membrane protein